MEEREAIRERYAAAAGTSVDPMMKDGGRAGCSCYEPADLELLPVGMASTSLGCANPVALADLRQGEIVLDLGSGAGLDTLLSARRVGPSGRVYGLDMTDEMLKLARANQLAAGIDNVEFLKGFVEAVPLPEDSVDVVVSNCVINLSIDKEAVFSEIFRVLRVGGRIAIADVVDEESLDERSRAATVAESPCLAMALTTKRYRTGLERAGFEAISIEPSHTVAPGFVSAFIRASKSSAAA